MRSCSNRFTHLHSLPLCDRPLTGLFTRSAFTAPLTLLKTSFELNWHVLSVPGMWKVFHIIRITIKILLVIIFLPVILLPMRLVFAIPKSEDHHSHGFSNIWDLFECKWFSGAQWGTQKYINNLTVQHLNYYIYSHIIDKLKGFFTVKMIQ